MKARYSPCFSVKGCRLERRDTPDFWFICRFVWASNQEAEMNVRYRVELSQAERDELTAMLSAGKHAARKLKRAQMLLAADVGSSDEQIARTVVVGGSTVYRTKRRFVEGNLERALTEEPRPGAERKLTGKEEALLVATACAKPPAGRARWTLELLAGEMVKLTDHESLSPETVRRRLAENHLKPWRKDMWCIPRVDGEYVARMEDVLDLYAETPDSQRPVVCFDESPVQLIGEVRQPIPAAPGQLERYDYEYRRNGTVNLFVFLDANRPWRKSQRRHDPGRPGQLVEPLGRRPLPDLSGRSPAHPAPPRVPLHPQARQLAQHGRDRDRGAARPMPRPSNRPSRGTQLRDRRMGAATKRDRRSHRRGAPAHPGRARPA